MGRESSDGVRTEPLLMESQVDTTKITDEVMAGLDKFRLKGEEEEKAQKDEEESDSGESGPEAKADPLPPQSREPFSQESPEPPRKELSPEPHKPASPEQFRQESPEPPKTQNSRLSPDREVILEQPQQHQFPAVESRDATADILGDHFQQQQQQQQSVPQGKFFYNDLICRTPSTEEFSCYY